MEGDDEDIAPVPPHERAWRHPAEVSDESRRRHAVESAPPPVGRRVTALVGFVSIVASGVIAFVAVPKGIDQQTEVSSEPVTSTPPKGGTAPIPSVRIRANAAIVVAQGLAVVAGSLSANEDTVTLTDGSTVSATPISTIDEHGITIVRTDSVTMPRTNELSDDEFKYLGDEGRLSLVLDDGTSETTRFGLSTRDTGRWWPLSIDSKGSPTLARIVDADGALVGIAVREKHETWAMKLSDLLDVINDGDGAQGG